MKFLTEPVTNFVDICRVVIKTLKGKSSNIARKLLSELKAEFENDGFELTTREFDTDYEKDMTKIELRHSGKNMRYDLHVTVLVNGETLFEFLDGSGYIYANDYDKFKNKVIENLRG